MKLNHTLLSAVASKKKLLLGTLALALVGGTAPALINKTHAVAPIPTMYTTVGPEYFTVTDFSNNSDVTFRIADTSVADFYYGRGGSIEKSAGAAAIAKDGPSYPIDSHICRYNNYGCIQGKKIGSTEIIVEADGEEITRIPLVSVKLSPDAYGYIKPGNTITGTGTIEGADNSLLKLYKASSSNEEYISAVKTGDRGFTIATTSDSIWEEAWLIWQIGDQYVGGGTYYNILPINATDNLYHSTENEAKLEFALFNILNQLNMNGANPGTVVHGDDGSELLFEPESGTSGIASSFGVALDSERAKLAEATKDDLASGFPEGAKGIKFEDVKADFTLCFDSSEEVLRLVPSEVVNNNTNCYYMGKFTKLGQDLDMAISVENVAGVKAGYARKWYVTRDNNGVIERIEATYDEETKTIHFKSNGLGFYAYGYVDEKINDVPGVPNTGAKPMQQIATAVATIMPITTAIIFSSVLAIKKRTAKKMAKKFNHFN